MRRRLLWVFLLAGLGAGVGAFLAGGAGAAVGGGLGALLGEGRRG